jgi:hypothetical protein
MEKNLPDLLTANSKTNYDQSFSTSSELNARGLVIRYDTIHYRGQDINFLSDVDGTHVAAQWNDQVVDLGINNIYYKDDMCKFVDRQLDLITEFTEFPELAGAKLEWFRNGDYRDIRLLYKGRILKVFVTVTNAVNETFLISESKNILYNSGLLEN